MRLKEKDFWLGFNIFKGIGPKRFQHLLKVFGSARRAWKASAKELRETKLPSSIIKHFLLFRQETNLAKTVLELEKKLIRYITLQDKEYPPNLKKISFPPPTLFLKGKIIPQDTLAIGVIGTRKITPYGREVTEKLTAGLTACGLTIISGLARGVDSVSHRVSLGSGGRTLAVLGSGLDRIYPPEHQALAEKIVKSGALISALAPGTPPLKGHFPSRNRLISGLSLGILVTEGAAVSGTKITSRFCLKQGRKLLAVPGPITSSLSEGPADLIKMGARLVTKVEDILEELEVKKRPALPGQKEDPALTKKGEIKFKDREEELIWQSLTEGGRHIDEIIRQTGFSSAEVLSVLTELELAGKVKNIGQGNYIII